MPSGRQAVFKHTAQLKHASVTEWLRSTGCFCPKGDDTCHVWETLSLELLGRPATFPPHCWWTRVVLFSSHVLSKLPHQPSPRQTEVKGSQTSDFPQVLTSLHTHQPLMKFLGPLYSDNWVLAAIPKFWMLGLEKTYIQIVNLNQGERKDKQDNEQNPRRAERL